MMFEDWSKALRKFPKSTVEDAVERICAQHAIAGSGSRAPSLPQLIGACRDIQGSSVTEKAQKARQGDEPHLRDPDFMETFKWKQGLPKRFGDHWSYLVESKRMGCVTAKDEVIRLMAEMGESE